MFIVGSYDNEYTYLYLTIQWNMCHIVSDSDGQETTSVLHFLVAFIHYPKSISLNIVLVKCRLIKHQV
jgi:hypothetical protein